MSKSYIKCSECNTFNLNQEYCSNCGALLDLVLKRRLKRRLETEKKLQEKNNQNESVNKGSNRFEVFFDKGLEHSNIIIRSIFKAVYSIWLFFAVIIGGLIALVTATVVG